MLKVGEVLVVSAKEISQKIRLVYHIYLKILYLFEDIYLNLFKYLFIHVAENWDNRHVP